MEIDRIPPELLNGKSLHFKPVEDGPIIEAPIFPSEGLSPTARVIIVCPAKLPASKCVARIIFKNSSIYCQWYKGDSKGDYQIIGPNMDIKSGRGYKDT